MCLGSALSVSLQGIHKTEKEQERECLIITDKGPIYTSVQH